MGGEARIDTLYTHLLRAILRAWRGFATDCMDARAQQADSFARDVALNHWRNRMPQLRREAARIAAALRHRVRKRLRAWHRLAHAHVQLGLLLSDGAEPRARRRSLLRHAARWRTLSSARKHRITQQLWVRSSSTRRDCARALVAWRTLLALGMSRGGRRRARRIALMAAIRRWGGYATMDSVRSKITASGLAASTRDRVCALLIRWSANAHLLLTGRRAASRVALSRCYNALGSLMEHAHRRGRAALLRPRVLRHLRQKMVLAMRTWRRALRYREAASRMGNRAMVYSSKAALRTWRLHSDETALSVALALGAARHSRLQLTSDAIGRWRRIAHHRRRCGLAIAKMQSHRSVAALNQWKAEARRQANSPTERLITSVMGSSKARALSGAMDWWVYVWRTVGRSHRVLR